MHGQRLGIQLEGFIRTEGAHCHATKFFVHDGGHAAMLTDDGRRLIDGGCHNATCIAVIPVAPVGHKMAGVAPAPTGNYR